MHFFKIEIQKTQENYLKSIATDVQAHIDHFFRRFSLYLDI